MKTILRILAGAIAFPIVGVACLFVLSIWIAIVVAFCCFTVPIWLVLFCPITLINGLFNYAIGKNASDSFKPFRRSFVYVVDATGIIRETIIPLIQIICEAIAEGTICLIDVYHQYVDAVCAKIRNES